MLILNSAKMIFVHLQRSGGSSVEISFSPVRKWNDITLGSTQLGEAIQWLYFGEFGLHKHSTAAEIRRVVGETYWASCYCWATVRNPFDIICSFYGATAALIEPVLAQDPRFPGRASLAEREQWLDSGDYPKDGPWAVPSVRAYLRGRGRDDGMSRFLRAPELESEATMWPQAHRISDESGRLVVDEFVKLEGLAARWPALLQRLAMPALPLLYANPTPAERRIGRGQAYRNPEDVEWVVSRFALDFETFKYATDPWTLEQPVVAAPPVLARSRAGR